MQSYLLYFTHIDPVSCKPNGLTSKDLTITVNTSLHCVSLARDHTFCALLRRWGDKKQEKCSSRHTLCQLSHIAVMGKKKAPKHQLPPFQNTPAPRLGRAAMLGFFTGGTQALITE